MSIKKLIKLSESANIANELSDEKKLEIVSDAIKGFEADKESMSDWLDSANNIMDLVKLKAEIKNTPWHGAASIKYPLISTAIIQFAAHTLPEVIKENKAARAKILGKDPEGKKMRKGDRSMEYMNYKLLYESNTWMQETDKTFHQAAAIGTVIKKSYFDPVKQQTNSRLVPYNRIVINKNIISIEEAPRITHIIDMSINDIRAGQRLGYYSNISMNGSKDKAGNDKALESLQSGAEADDNNFNPEFLEQHCWLDLDDDTFQEPYTVLFHADTMQILRITANYQPEDVRLNEKDQVVEIKARTFFTDYHFIPNPDGTFWSYGFGTFLESMNHTINTLFNQLIDAGTLSNMKGGIIGKGLNMRKGKSSMGPGEWLTAESITGRAIRDEVFQLEYGEPSTVLFQLLTFLLTNLKEFTSTTDALTGVADTQNTSPASLHAIIKQGLKVFNTVQQRMNIGMRKELKKIYEIYAIHTSTEEYQNVLDLTDEELAEATSGTFNVITDFDFRSLDVLPVADYNSSTETERMLQNKQLMEIMAFAGPLVNAKEILRRNFVGIGVEDPDSLLNNEEPRPDINDIKITSEIDFKAKQLELDQRKLELDRQKLEIEMYKAQTKGIKDIADAEAAQEGQQLNMYKQFADNMLEAKRLSLQESEMNANRETGEDI